jgi:hypothetical protein
MRASGPRPHGFARTRVVGHAAHPVQIGARAKSRAVGGQHDAAHVVARAQFNKGLRHLGDDFVVKGVAHLGAVQRDGGDVACDVYQQMFHGPASLNTVSPLLRA